MTARPRPAIQDSKGQVREEVRQRLAGMTVAQAACASRAACALLQRQAIWRRSSSILFYAPVAGEVDVWPLLATALAQGKRTLLPRFSAILNHYQAGEVRDLEADIVPGKFRIREAAPHCAEFSLNRLDFALVPGVAFDLHGRRLGRGKGFFDRLLSVVRGARCGVAFDEQIVPAVPVEPHDITLNCILTPTRWLEL